MSQTFTPPLYSLGPDFYDKVEPASFPKAILRYRNQTAAKGVGLENLSESQWQEHFWAFKPLPENISTPLCLRYHGHQFQNYNPELGDGRGFLFAQLLQGSQLLDLGTKGSGQTPYSRNGDGRLTLKGAFREILATELLESLGVNTSKTFSVFETGESLIRYDEPSPTRSAVLVRLSHSHIRYGTFQRLAYLGQTDNIKKLMQYCLQNFYPDLLPYEESEQAFLFLRKVQASAIQTLAEWMIVGFVHGVLNTDNMNITGESFDYGPYRFLPHYDPHFTAAYFDHSGLYAFGRQPTAVLWNLFQLGSSLKTAFPHLGVEEALEDFGDLFNSELLRLLLIRLNLKNPLQDEAAASKLGQDLVVHFFQFLDDSKALYEQTFFDLHSGVHAERIEKSPQKSRYVGTTFQTLSDTLDCFEVLDEDKRNHAYFTSSSPCSLLIGELEAIWSPIADKDDWSLFDQKLSAIRSFRGLYQYR